MFDLRNELAQLAFQRQRTAAGLAPTAHGVAVITDAVGQQEVGIGVFDGEPLRGLPICDQEATSQSRQQSFGCSSQTVGEANDVRKPPGCSIRRGILSPVLSSLSPGMNQERGPSVRLSVHQLNAALGLTPI